MSSLAKGISDASRRQGGERPAMPGRGKQGRRKRGAGERHVPERRGNRAPSTSAAAGGDDHGRDGKAGGRRRHSRHAGKADHGAGAGFGSVPGQMPPMPGWTCGAAMGPRSAARASARMVMSGTAANISSMASTMMSDDQVPEPALRHPRRPRVPPRPGSRPPRRRSRRPRRSGRRRRTESGGLGQIAGEGLQEGGKLALSGSPSRRPPRRRRPGKGTGRARLRAPRRPAGQYGGDQGRPLQRRLGVAFSDPASAVASSASSPSRRRREPDATRRRGARHAFPGEPEAMSAPSQAAGRAGVADTALFRRHFQPMAAGEVRRGKPATAASAGGEGQRARSVRPSCGCLAAPGRWLASGA